MRISYVQAWPLAMSKIKIKIKINIEKTEAIIG